MYFAIEHLTRYEYTLPVTLSEHLLRFTPLPIPSQQLLSYRLDITPQPVARVDGTDAWGNLIQRIHFSGETPVLDIQVHLEVSTQTSHTDLPLPPLGLPPTYGSEAPALAAYLTLLEQPTQLAPFLEPILAGAGNDLCTFLEHLNAAIHGFYHQGVRLEGPPRSPAETVQRKEGVCRDLAVLFMAGCRQLGIASRFVSGYQQGDGYRQHRYLHAWAEAYLPGWGWLGFDPTHGTRVGDDHVAIAAAPSPEGTMPVEGGYTFTGAEITSTLTTDIRITTRRDTG